MRIELSDPALTILEEMIVDNRDPRPFDEDDKSAVGELLVEGLVELDDSDSTAAGRTTAGPIRKTSSPRSGSGGCSTRSGTTTRRRSRSPPTRPRSPTTDSSFGPTSGPRCGTSPGFWMLAEQVRSAGSGSPCSPLLTGDRSVIVGTAQTLSADA